MRIATGKTTYLGFGAALAILIASGAIAHRSLGHLMANTAWVDHSHLVLQDLNAALSQITDEESGQLGFVVTGDERLLERYSAASGTIAGTVETLRHLTADDPGQQSRLNRLEPLITRKTAARQKLIDLRKSAGPGASLEVHATLGLMDEIRQVIQEMTAREETLLRERTQRTETSARTAQRTILLGSLLACLIVPFSILLINHDMAPRRKAELAVHEGEECLKAIVDNSAAVILLKDTEGRFLLINRQFEHLTGITNNDAQGKTDYDLFPKATADAARENDRQVIGSGETLVREEVMPHPDGLHTYISCKFPLRDATSRIYAVATIATDITGRKEAEEDLRRARDDLETHVQERTAQLATANENLKSLASALRQNNRQLQEFADVSSHDLQEPLRKIMAFGSRLQNKHGGALPADGRDCLARMLSSAQRMQKLIDDLLSFSRVATHAQPFARVDLKRVAEEALSDLGARVAQTRGRVEIGTLPAIEADATQMRQLLQNLIGNALKFHRPETPPLVKVHARRIPEKKASGEGNPAVPASCQIVVEDNGIGFDEACLDRILKPFQRLHTRSEGYEGTGIGLTICRKIAERHSGRITARSTPGRGSTFVVTLLTNQANHPNAGETEWNRRESSSPSVSAGPTMIPTSAN